MQDKPIQKNQSVESAPCAKLWCWSPALFNGLCFLPLLFDSLSPLACCPLSGPTLPPSSRLASPQLNLIHSEVSNLAGFDVEGVINPTTAELELKDDLGETPQVNMDHSEELWKKKFLNVSAVQRVPKRVTLKNVTIPYQLYLFELFYCKDWISRSCFLKDSLFLWLHSRTFFKAPHSGALVFPCCLTP